MFRKTELMFRKENYSVFVNPSWVDPHLRRSGGGDITPFSPQFRVSMVFVKLVQTVNRWYNDIRVKAVTICTVLLTLSLTNGINIYTQKIVHLKHGSHFNL